jgi:hypothetical protein
MPPPRPAPGREPALPKGVERDIPNVPPELRKQDLSNASAEDIAKMLGSKNPVIPPAPDQPEEAAPVATAANGNGHTTNGNGAAADAAPGAPAPVHAGASDGGVDLAALVPEIRKQARPRSVKLDALLNGSCEAVSWEGGILTLGFYQDGFPKKSTEEAANRKVYEEIAAAILGAPVSIRCIIAAKPARGAKSPLVQHAVERHGATIVSGDQEP